MNSPALGIGYGFWLKLRGIVFGMLMSTLALAATIHVFPETAPYCCVASMLILFLPLVLLLNTFSMGPADLGVKTSGFPQHMKVLPVSTHALVGWPMLFAAVTLAALWIIPACLIFMPAGFHIPVFWPATMLVTLCLWVQAIGWCPMPSPFVRVPLLILAFAPLMLPLAFGMTFSKGTMLAHVISIGCLTWSVAAYLVGVKGLSHARSGSGEGDWLRPIADWWMDRVQGRFVSTATRRPFRSAFSAQLWHECRRNAIVLPVMTAFVSLPMLPLLMLPILSSDRQQSFAVGATNVPVPMFILLLWGGLPMFFALTQGGGMAKLDIWGKTAMPAFFATRPLTTSQLVLIKFIATAVSVIAAWTITLGLFAAWAVVEASPLNSHPSIIRAIWAEATPRTAAIVVFVLIGILAVTWRNIVSGMWPTLLGRKYLANGIGFAFMGILALIGMAGTWVYKHPAFHAFFWHGLPWLLGAEVVFKLIVAVCLGVALQQRGLMSPTAVGLFAAGWLVLAGTIVGVLSLFVTPTWMMAAIVVLMVPFPSLAVAPLALDWNRHR
jgi:hypothetical protein